MTNLMRIFFENPGNVFQTWYKSFYPTLYPSVNVAPTPPPVGNTYYFAPRYFPQTYFSKGYFGAF